MHLNIYVDGASWGNPGPAAIGVIIKDEHQRELSKVSEYIGEGTNNQAEYQAVIAALRAATERGAKSVTLYLDSELVTKQLAGSYRVRNLSLFSLYREAVELSQKLDCVSVVHIRHGMNAEAHALARAALKAYLRRQAQI